MDSKRKDERCPCGRASLETCCGPLLDGTSSATTAEDLMRSRYSAYSLGRADYLWRTHSPEHRAERVQSLDNDLSWLGLTVHSHSYGGANHDWGIVEFSAVFEVGGERQVLSERSNFVKQQGQWLYTDGTMLDIKPGRNDPCWCLSGKKFKKCHKD